MYPLPLIQVNGRVHKLWSGQVGCALAPDTMIQGVFQVWVYTSFNHVCVVSQSLIHCSTHSITTITPFPSSLSHCLPWWVARWLLMPPQHTTRVVRLHCFLFLGFVFICCLFCLSNLSGLSFVSVCLLVCPVKPFLNLILPQSTQI